MNKEDILKELKELNKFEMSTFIILSGASLVLQEIITDTKDIDITTTINDYEKLDLKVEKGAFNIDIKTYKNFDISYNLFDEIDYIIVNGYKCATLESVYKIKKKLNRKKDFEIIKKLEEILFP